MNHRTLSIRAIPSGEDVPLSPNHVEILLDGKKLEGVTSLWFKMTPDELVEVTLSLYLYELTVDAAVIEKHGHGPFSFNLIAPK